MTNIFLTKKCNLKCPYCFASEFVNKDCLKSQQNDENNTKNVCTDPESAEITLENFKTALEFIKKNNDERVGLIGGEPLLHSKFGEMIDIISADEDIKNVIIYTNGTLVNKYIEKFSNEKYQLLVNCNSPKDMGAMYDVLVENVKQLQKYCQGRFTLGVNLYSKDVDFDYIFDLLKLTDTKRLRISLSLSNDEKEEAEDILQNFRDIKPFLFNFFRKCYDRDIIPRYDCNSLPDCVLDVEDKRFLLMMKQKAAKIGIQGDTISSCRTCNPVIDILPNLKAVRCFGLSKYLKADIEGFKDPDMMRSYFDSKIDAFAKVTYVNENCEECKSMYLNRCGVCYTYKLKKIKDLKEYLKYPKFQDRLINEIKNLKNH